MMKSTYGIPGKKSIAFLALYVLFTAGSPLTGQNPDTIGFYNEYAVKDGNLWFSNIGLAFSGMTNKDIMTDTVFYFNASQRPMAIWFEKLPHFITLNAIPDTLPPLGTGKLAVTYSAPAKGSYGRVVDYFFFYTDDTEKPKKRIIVSPTIMEDFSQLTESELQQAPVIRFAETEFDFGTIRAGDTVSHGFIFSNDGIRPLVIRAAHPSCGCTSAIIVNNTVDSGEKGEIIAVFNSFRKEGNQYYTVAVVSNDPAQSQVNLVIKGIVKP